MLQKVSLPPFIRFCEAIVGRITPPRGNGASGSESLCNCPKKEEIFPINYFSKKKIRFSIRKFLPHDSMLQWIHFERLTMAFCWLLYYFVCWLSDLRWNFVGYLLLVYMNVNFATWNLRNAKSIKRVNNFHGQCAIDSVSHWDMNTKDQSRRRQTN